MKRFFTLLIILFIAIQPISFVYAEPEDYINIDDINCEAIYMVEQNSGKVLINKNSTERLYPASITKVMTALLAIENFDMNESITIGREINLKSLDASGAGLVAGETMNMSDLLRALLIPSGNDAAYSVAVQVARKVADDPEMRTQDAIDNFSELMTKRAKELGAKDTNFVNPHGYHDDNHYSTAYDLYLIVTEAMKHDIFNEIVGTQYYSTKNSDKDAGKDGKKVEHSWVNRNLMLGKNSGYYFKEATGVKTGFTSKAGYCLISSAENEDLSLILVTLNFPTEKERWEQSVKLLDYTLKNYQLHTIVKKDDIVTNVKVGKKYLNKTVNLDVIAEKEYSDLINKKDILEIKTIIQWDSALLDTRKGSKGAEKLIGPIKEGQILGKVVYSLNNEVLSEINLIASEGVMKLNVIDYILDAGNYVIRYWYIFAIPLLVIGLLLVAFKLSKRRRSDRDRGVRTKHRY